MKNVFEKKRVAGVMAVSLLAVTVISACSSKDESKETSTDGPKNVSILLSHTLAKYAMQYKEDDIYTKELSKLSGFNLKYEFVGHNADFVQQMTVRFASKDLPDLVRTDSILSTIHPGAVEQNVFTPLNELLDKYGPNIKKKIAKEQWDSPKISKDGKIYGIPSLAAVPAYRVIYMRQDWLDKLNMQQPKTLDDYLKYFEAVKVQDMNGNGDPNDEYGFYVRENLDYGDIFFKEFGVHPREWILRDGKLQAGLIQPEIKEGLKFWKNLYEKGYINPNLFTNKSSDWRAGIKQGKGGSWMHDVPNYAADWQPSLFVNEKNVKISMLPGPEGPKGKGLSPVSDQIGFVWVIPSSSKNAINVIKFLDWAWSDEKAEKFFAYGIEGYNYTMENGKVKYDANSKANTENDANEFFRATGNPRKDGRLDPLVLAVDPNAELLTKGLDAANQSIYKNDGLHMPVLEALKTRPELAFGGGTLFMDMFAKVITGKADLDASFDEFVKEWKRRGGDQAIEEATAWYNKFHNKK
jgi:putative aldouronate transport system substrate-binding protein